MAETATQTLVCDFCGNPSDKVGQFFIGQHVDPNCNIHTGHICSECIGLFMNVMAHDDREVFEKMVEEARAN